jgi:hypothetical protein
MLTRYKAMILAVAGLQLSCCEGKPDSGGTHAWEAVWAGPTDSTLALAVSLLSDTIDPGSAPRIVYSVHNGTQPRLFINSLNHFLFSIVDSQSRPVLPVTFQPMPTAGRSREEEVFLPSRAHFG